MEELEKKLKKAIEDAQKIINEDEKWEVDYKNSAELILKNKSKIEELRKNFHRYEPLKFYLTIGNMKNLKNTLYISVRYQGQAIAMLSINKDNKVLISTKDFDSNNEKFFNCNIKLSNAEWDGKEAAEFRKYFATYPKRTSNDNEEHRIESMLINEFSKDSSVDKKLCNIQPIKVAGLPFSMPTIISGSKEIKKGDGHIDIFARNNKKITVIELKDENKKSEPIEKVLQQATGYAVFIINLLRSESGKDWYKIFEFSKEMPQDNLLIKVCSAMPKKTNFDVDKFKPFTLDCGKDKLEYNWLFFEEDGKEITDIDTSL